MFLPFAAGAPFQTPHLELGNPSFATFPDFGSSGPGSFGATAAGDLDGDLNAELAVVAGAKLALFPSPAVLDDGVWMAFEVQDVCFTSDYDGSGQPAFLVTSTRGLEALVYDSTSYSLLSLSTELPWVNAKVRAGIERSGGIAVPVLVGWNPLTNAVFQAFWSGGVLGAPTTLYTLVNTVLDLQLLDWNGDSNDVQEVALLHTGGLQIRPRITGATPILGRPAPVSDDSIAVLRKPSNPYDLLAWTVHPTAESDQSLLLLCQEFWAVSPGPYLGPYPLTELGANIVDLAGGDLQGELMDALVMTPESGNVLAVCRNYSLGSSWLSAGGEGPFKVNVPDWLELVGEDPPHGVVCADFFAQHDANGNTVETLAVVRPSHEDVAVYPIHESWEKLGLLQAPEGCFSNAIYVSAGTTFGCTGPCLGPGQWYVFLANGWGSTPGANMVEMVVRVSFNNSVVNNTAFHHEFFGLTDLEGMLVDFETDSDPAYFDDVDDCVADPLPWSFFLMVRPVIADANYAVSTAWPWAILSMSAHCQGFCWLKSRPGASSVAPCHEGNTCIQLDPCSAETGPCNDNLPTYGSCPTFLTGSSYIPSPVPQARIPSAGHVLPIIYPPHY